MKSTKLVAVVGETASGKSSLALQIAQRFNGEIICADSTTVRRGADIGTAKPSLAERALVPHHLLDIIESDERFTVADFQELAYAAIEDIEWRGRLPIMVGGTGLYVDSVLYDYKFGAKGDVDRREQRDNCLTIGLQIERDELKKRIEQRVDGMLAAGLEAEVRGLAERYGWDCLALKNVGYAQWQGADPRAEIIKATVNLAKRQRTWFKRNNSIHWLTAPVNMIEIEDLVTTFLST